MSVYCSWYESIHQTKNFIMKEKSKQEILSTEFQFGAFDMRHNYEVRKEGYLETKEYLVAIIDSSCYSDRGGGIERGCKIVVFNWQGETVFQTREYTYRNASSSSLDDYGNYFKEVVSINNQSVTVMSVNGERVIPVS